MTDQIRALLNQIQVLEDELKDAMHEQETLALYRIEGTRIEFEQRVAEAHRRNPGFAAYGDAQGYRDTAHISRNRLRDELGG